MGGLLGLLAGFMFVIFIIVIAVYIIASLGLMKIANKTGEKASWMAWVPFCNFYLLGKLGVNKIVGWLLALLPIGSAQFTTTVNGEVVASGSVLPAPLNSIASLAFLILLIISLHRIYNKFSDKAVLMTVFTVLTFGLLAPIFLLVISKNEVRA